ncbi:hypothetical protein LTR78_002727 [Recurvomyces mirabilis]|uniref:Uncharacterized protein n=1 Tax=Recurvomyces mirabilis TaxID=574656 RepID=A0AAE0WT89_9PEZI|nr:hypothetical protein LTR78_002727 [Recurvomyces mirabilis]KAK5159538.1 hypothetical protein LTS14_002680 [Recurvomyces mirabilis]
MDAVRIEAKDQYKKAKPWKQEEELKSSFSEQTEANPFGSVETSPNKDEKTKRPASLTAEMLDAGAETLRSPTRAYVLAKHTALNFISQRKKWPQVVHERVKRWLEARTGRSLQHSRDIQKHVAWNADMAAMVLYFLQEDAIRTVRIGIHHKYVLDKQEFLQQNLVQFNTDDQAAEAVAAQNVACVLMVNEHSGQLPPCLQQASIPVYTLRDLLGRHITTLDEITTDDDSAKQLGGLEWLVVWRDPRAVKLQLALMKLEGYADP